MSKMAEIDEGLLEELYRWVDQIPLSRPKKDIRRDFSDGVLVAEVVKHFCPKMVEIHNYVSGTGTKQKQTNWFLLNRKVFKKLGFELGDDVIRNIITCKPWAVEQTLMLLRRKIEGHRKKQHGHVSDRPEADQGIKVEQSPVSDPHSNSQSALSPGQFPSTSNIRKAGSLQNLTGTGPGNQRSDMVAKIMVEEKEQEILAKDETIQILQAKIRRLEHLLHLKDIRIDDLQGRVERLEYQQPSRAPRGGGKR